MRASKIVYFGLLFFCLSAYSCGLLAQQTDALPASGQWFDRTHSGHGLDLNRANGTLFGTFYTYDASGAPEWLWLQVPDQPAPSGVLTRFQKQGTAAAQPSAVGQFSLRFVNQCSDAIARPGASALFEFVFNTPQGQGRWCLEPLLPATSVAETALNGHWYMSGPDSGWGLVTHFYPSTTPGAPVQTFQAFYYYDDDGNPRWSVANGASSGFLQTQNFFDLRTRCFGCPTAIATGAVPVGQITQNLNSAHPGAINTLRASMRFSGANSFVRSGNLRLLSQPRAVAQVRSSKQGLLQGSVDANGIERYTTIPYAAAPIGSLRFRAPQPVPNRSRVLDARIIGPACMQPSQQGFFGSTPASQNEDCLFLNIWQPANSAGALPVMVWIHGGGLTFGSAVDQIGTRLVYDGTVLAKKNVLMVSINYRLGAFGYAAPRAMQGEAPDQPSAGNYGLLDQIAALNWVNENIAQFGGDPNNVTIFGESAGGVSTCALLAAPAARGLFARAIAQSGNCLRNVPSLDAALTQADRLTAALGCNDPVNARVCLRAVSAAQLLSLSRAISLIGSAASGESYSLNIDRFSLLEPPALAISSGRATKVPLMLGVNDDENTSLTPASTLPNTFEAYAALVRSKFALISELVLARYPPVNYPTPASAYQDILDDVQFTCANRRAAGDHAAMGNAVFHYALTDSLSDANLAGLGSFHGLDIGYLFGRNTANSRELALSEKMQTAWTRFARIGDPTDALGYLWPRFDGNRRSAELNASAIGSINDYRGEFCDFWNRYTPL